MIELILWVVLVVVLLLFGAWLLAALRTDQAQSEMKVTTDCIAHDAEGDELLADVPRWLGVSAAIGVLLGVVLMWATGGDSEQPRHYPGSSDACIVYEGSPYVFDAVVTVGAFLSPFLVVAWILWALIRRRGPTRWVMVGVGLIFAFDSALAILYANQLYLMRGGCS